MAAKHYISSDPHTYLPLLCLALLPLLILSSCYMPNESYMLVSGAGAKYSEKTNLQVLLDNSTSYETVAYAPKANPFRSIHTHSIDQALIQLRLLKEREASESLDYYHTKRMNAPQGNQQLANWLSSFLPTKQTQSMMFTSAKYCGLAMFLVVLKEALY
ncbi:hypothetical protein K493DRAFT_313121 [Basidiobolus meristosporus CBS 931.73]|uniref:Uncharacterized protein n=1 Tax=Basidiobolus meristosporus CBS 931.73 TaxID=1314790 RepID=A0A1Y1YP41_9FUNG|nr:hypothetical protein K493DRAFT_313121 [Basidiobolus meristosporus CBS 931.73]|eukprot:ORX99745.1 hypothetical protein K493DRAFT_313121 [Basidiobolus meristosporus CBS 931.73]